MRFVFLGTGTSAGVPAIGCDCAVCRSDDPRDRRLRTSAALEWIDPHGRPRAVLLDAGPDLRQQALGASLRRCDAVLFTHNHVDHTFGLDEVRRFNVAQGGPVEVLAEPHTMDHLRRVYRHIFESAANVNDSFVAHLIPRLIGPGEAIDLFGVRFTPFRLLHGRLPILGYRIEPGAALLRGPDAPFWAAHFPLAYCTDVSGFPPEAFAAVRGLRTLVLDALRRRHHPTHLTLDQAVGLAGRIGAGRTYFVHMAHDLPHAATEAELPDGVRLAYDGLVLS